MAAKLSGVSGKYNVGQNSDINVTPFVDVMLVLLIIFMVAAPLATVSIKLDLPPATNQPVVKQNKPPTVVWLQKSGAIFVGGTETTLPQLADAIAASIGGANPRAESVYIRADKDVRYSQFMSAVNQLQTTGYFKVSLITEDESPAS